jgi:glycosyltransferase involved in cell wall biosynthesis
LNDLGQRSLRAAVAAVPAVPGNRRVLISTIAPVSGGVPTMTAFIVRALRGRGFDPILAHYEPYSVSPALSVPAVRLFGGRVGHETRSAFDGCESHAIGAWLPELEVTHYRATPVWRRLIEGATACLVVSGNALGALPFYQLQRPFLAWLASGWAADRQHRVAGFAWPRAVLDRAVVRPAARRLERKILNRGAILSLSDYTRRTLDRIAGRAVVRDVLPMPIDTEFFRPQPGVGVRGRIGFSGRLDDPRKNVGLLLAALSLLRKNGDAVSALLIGAEPSATLSAQLAAYGIERDVTLQPYAVRETLREHLRSLDLFVVPSHQEGLCIAALEAMACGIPVVSTRCGGPEEFVIDGETGSLVDFDAAAMADAIATIVHDRDQRERSAAGARAMVLRHYSNERAERIFWMQFDRTFSGSIEGLA